jgi:PAS domain S-box-containing protein
MTVDPREPLLRPPDEGLHRSLIEHVPAVVYVVSHDDPPDTLYVSPQVEQLVGLTPAALMQDSTLWRSHMHPDDRDPVVASWNETLATDDTFSGEYRIVRPDGRAVWLRDDSQLRRDDEGRGLYWQGVLRDVTQRGDAEQALRDSELRYRTLVEQLPVLVYIDSDDEEPDSIYVSPNSERILGYTPQDYLADPTLWPRSMHPDDRERVLAEWAETVRRREPFQREYRLMRPDGRAVWIRDHSMPVFDDEGDLTSWQGVIEDVTERHEAEEQLRTSEERYRALIEQVPAIVYEMGPDDERRTHYVSPHVEEIFGYTRDEWLDQPDIWVELLHPDDRETELAAHDRQAAAGGPWGREYRLIANDGRVVWVSDQAKLVEATGHPPTWHGVMLDITARKEAEERLRLSYDELEFGVRKRTAELEEANEMMALEIGERRRVEARLTEAERRYRHLVEEMPAVAYVWDVSPGVGGEPDRNYVSPQALKMFGFPLAEWMRDELWRERLHPHDRDAVETLFQAARQSGDLHAEYRLLHRDGHAVWVADRASLLSRDDAGRPKLIQGVMVDITRLKEAEAKVADVEGRFRSLVEEGPVVSYVYELDRSTDPPGVSIGYVSPQTADIVGYPIDHWKDEPLRWFEMMHPDDRDSMTAMAAQAWGTGEPWTAEYRMIRGDGSIVWIHDTGRAVAFDAEGQPTRFQGVLMEATPEHAAARVVREQAATMRSMLEKMPCIPWTEVIDETTGHARLTHLGPQVVDVLGYTPEELLAEPGHFTRLVHPDDLDRVTRRIERVNRSAEPYEDSYRAIARDGTNVWLYVCAVPESDPAGALQVWHGITIEVRREQVIRVGEAPERARADTGAASREAPPTRPSAGGSPAAR